MTRSGDLRSRLLRGSLVSVLALGVLAVTAAPSPAAVTQVGTLTDLTTGLADCTGTPEAPYEVALDADLSDGVPSPTTELTVNCDAVIDLAGHDLTVRNVIVSTGKSWEVTDTTDNPGTLTANASLAPNVAGIQTTGATLTTSGTARLIATGGNSGAGIGGGQGGDGGTVTSNGTSSIIATGGQFGAAGIGGGEDGNGGTVTANGDSTIVASGQHGAGIGGGLNGSGGTVATNGSSTITASAIYGAGIGGGAGSGSGGTVIANDISTIVATGGRYSAGIGGGTNGGAAGSVTSNDSSAVTANGGDFGAGIGGGDGGHGGTLTTNDASTITATGGMWGAGIGGGYQGHGGTLTTNDASTITATGGKWGAGIGGGNEGHGGTLTTNDTSTLTATGGQQAAGIGGGLLGSPGSTSITGGSTVRATAGTGGSAGGSAVGVGDGGTPTPGTFLSVTNGSLKLGSDLTVSDADSNPTTTEVTIGAGGVIAAASPPREVAITGSGTVANGGAITLPTDAIDPTLVTDRHYLVTFDAQGGTPTPAAVSVFANTFVHGARAFPPDPTKPGFPFLGWNTQADGTGSAVTAATALPDLVGASPDGSPVPIQLFAQWTASPTLVWDSSRTLTITGPARTGTNLRASLSRTALLQGTDPDATRIRYRWLRDGAQVQATDRATYRASRRDVGHHIVLTVTLSRPGYDPVTLRTPPRRITR